MEVRWTHRRERPGYYAVFLRDLDGCNVEAVHHG